MVSYNKRSVTIFSIIITLIIYILIHVSFNSFKINSKKEESSNLILKTSKVNPVTTDKTEESQTQISTNQYKGSNWRIIISKINLDAPILEGTNKEVLRRAVGHFESTSKWNGNVCLAAHNRGYKYNYFQELKKLEVGDHIVYQTEKGEREYSVISKTKIKETDWSNLQETKDNYLTLLTCVENMPEYRLCIQAKQINN